MRRGRGADGFALGAWAVVLVLTLPVALGVLATLLPAFGWHPAAGARAPGIAAFADLFSTPSFWASLRTTLVTGVGAAILAVMVSFGGAACLYGTRWFDRLSAVLAPALAYPYASFAIGFAFLFAPSGWLARAVSPWATGWDRPPDLLILNDPNGIALMLALATKEALFLVLMIVAALGQVPARQMLRAAATMGYGRVTAFLKLVAPQLYPQLRLPIYAVLAAGLSNVDAAIILGPAAPPTLGPLTLDWFGQLGAEDQTRAAASCIAQLVLAAIVIVAWRAGEGVAARATSAWLADGRRASGFAPTAAVFAGSLLGPMLAVTAASILVLAMWSFAEAWPWPLGLPSGWSLLPWQSGMGTLSEAIANTACIGFGTAVAGVALAVLCLEAQSEGHRRVPSWLLYIPLLVPQIGFLFGVQLLWSRLWLDGTIAAVAATHLLFVLPYVFLVLRDPFAALDPRYAKASRVLGHGRLKTLVRVKLPLLIRPLMVAFAVGAAVSIGLYLPTVFAGAGRVPTLTTEAVALAAGADRRLAGVAAAALTAMPLLGFALATVIPAMVARRRRGLSL